MKWAMSSGASAALEPRSYKKPRPKPGLSITLLRSVQRLYRDRRSGGRGHDRSRGRGGRRGVGLRTRGRGRRLNTGGGGPFNGRRCATGHGFGAASDRRRRGGGRGSRSRRGRDFDRSGRDQRLGGRHCGGRGLHGRCGGLGGLGRSGGDRVRRRIRRAAAHQTRPRLRLRSPTLPSRCLRRAGNGHSPSARSGCRRPCRPSPRRR